jgi:uncharacterized damage-inducible protein DinB
MTLSEHFVRMARYNKWAYQVLFSKVNKLSIQQYNQAEILFSHSIHGTLCHLLLAEKLWYHRMNNSSLEQEFPGVNKLWALGADNGGEHWANVLPGADPLLVQQKILDQCDQWIQYMNTMEDKELDTEFSYQDTKGTTYTRVRSHTLDHVFNHSTHHRGQISCLIMKHLGAKEAPEMDLVYFYKQQSL